MELLFSELQDPFRPLWLCHTAFLSSFFFFFISSSWNGVSIPSSQVQLTFTVFLNIQEVQQCGNNSIKIFFVKVTWVQTLHCFKSIFPSNANYWGHAASSTLFSPDIKSQFWSSRNLTKKHKKRVENRQILSKRWKNSPSSSQRESFFFKYKLIYFNWRLIKRVI